MVQLAGEAPSQFRSCYGIRTWFSIAQLVALKTEISPEGGVWMCNSAAKKNKKKKIKKNWGGGYV